MPAGTTVTRTGRGLRLEYDVSGATRKVAAARAGMGRQAAQYVAAAVLRHLSDSIAAGVQADSGAPRPPPVRRPDGLRMFATGLLSRTLTAVTEATGKGAAHITIRATRQRVAALVMEARRGYKYLLAGGLTRAAALRGLHRWRVALRDGRLAPLRAEPMRVR